MTYAIARANRQKPIVHRTPPVWLAWWRSGASASGGALLFLAFPPADLWFLAPLGVALLALATYGAGPRQAMWLGYLNGLVFFVPALAWVRPVGYDAWLILAAVECLYFAAMSAGISLVARLRGWPVWVAALWVLQEWARGVFPLGGFPWVRVAFSQGNSSFTPYAALGGAPLVTFVVVLCGALLARVVIHLIRQELRAACLPLALALAVPLLAYAVPHAGGSGQTLRIGVIQGNVPGRGLGFLGDEPAVVLRNHADKTHELARAVRTGRLPKPDIVIWPENSTDIDPYRDASAYQIIDSAVRDIGVPVLVGAVVRREDGHHRSTRAIVWDPVKGPGAYYDKQKLVPFGEFVPFRDLLTRFIDRVNLVGPQSVAGDEDGDLPMGGVTVGAVQCYEVAFDGVVRDTVRAGGNPLVVQANNATYALTNLPPQQLAMSQLRAVEHGRAVITAATTGISAYVDPNGELRWQTAELVDDMTVVTVPVRTGQTIATRIGALPEQIFMLAGVGAVAVELARRARRRHPANGSVTRTSGS